MTDGLVVGPDDLLESFLIILHKEVGAVKSVEVLLRYLQAVVR